MSKDAVLAIHPSIAVALVVLLLIEPFQSWEVWDNARVIPTCGHRAEALMEWLLTFPGRLGCQTMKGRVASSGMSFV